MKDKVKIVSILLVMSLLLMSCGESDRVTVYTHNVEEEMQAFVSALKEETGIDVEFLRLSSEENWSRIEAEYPDVGAEMQWGMLHSLAILAANKDMLGSYHSPEWEDVPDEFKDPEGRWYGWSYWFNMLAVNTELLDDLGLDMPDSWEDLTDPQYKGEIVMPDPSTSGTAFLMVSTLMQIMGENEAWDYLEKLHENVGQYVQSGSAPAQLAAQGEYAIGITWDQAVFDHIEEGYPIEGVIPEEGVGYDLDVIWIFKGNEKNDRVQQIVDFIGSEKGMEVAAEYRSMVTKPGIEGSADFTPNLIDYDAVWSAENRDRIQEEWEKRFH